MVAFFGPHHDGVSARAADVEAASARTDTSAARESIVLSETFILSSIVRL